MSQSGNRLRKHILASLIAFIAVGSRADDHPTTPVPVPESPGPTGPLPWPEPGPGPTWMPKDDRWIVPREGESFRKSLSVREWEYERNILGRDWTR